MSISSRLRFEVLRRDGHRCFYCGKTAHERELHVDHVIASALGGADAPENLVTACPDCNLGKSSTPADATVVADVDRRAIEYRAAIERAAEMMRQTRREQDRRLGEFDALWRERADGLGIQAPLPVGWESSVLGFRKLGLPDEEIDALLRESLDKYKLPPEARWLYFCKCCWSAANKLTDTALDLIDPKSTSMPLPESPPVAASAAATLEARYAEFQEHVERPASWALEHLGELLDVHPAFSDLVRTGRISPELDGIINALRTIASKPALLDYLEGNAIRHCDGSQIETPWPLTRKFAPEALQLADHVLEMPIEEMRYNPGTDKVLLGPWLEGREVPYGNFAVTARIFGKQSASGQLWALYEEDWEIGRWPDTMPVCVLREAEEKALIFLLPRRGVLVAGEVPEEGHWASLAAHPPPFQPFDFSIDEPDQVEQVPSG